MAKGIAGVISGMLVWIIVATLGNFVLREALPGYADVEKAMTFTTPMMAARLVLGAVSSLCAGFAVAWIAKGSRRLPRLFAGILLLLFIPTHYQLWDKFPAWYHLIFLVSLVLVTLLGAALYPRLMRKE